MGLAAFVLLAGCSDDGERETLGTLSMPVTMTAVGSTTGSPDETSTGAPTTGVATTGSTTEQGTGSTGTTDASTTDASTTGAPMPVCGDGAVDAGEDHTCALRRSGAVVCWGSNAEGALGDGSDHTRLVPVPVIGLATATAIAAPSGSGACPQQRTWPSTTAQP